MRVTYLGCVPTNINDFIRDHLPRYEPDPGSERINCRECGTPMWIGPKQQEYAEQNPEVVKICLHCAVAMKDRFRSMEVTSLDDGVTETLQ